VKQTTFVCVDVAVFAPLKNLFTYRWPESLGVPCVGIRVRIPFGTSQRLGVVLHCSEKEQTENLKTVTDRLDIQPLYDECYQNWLARAARYYLAQSGRIWELGLAWAHDGKRRLRCVQPDRLKASDAALSAAFKTRAALSLSTLFARMEGAYPHYRLLCALAEGSLEEVVKTTQLASAYQAESRPATLRSAQMAAVQSVLRALQRFQSFLLFGVTGSGKTEVYLTVAEEVVRQGRQVLILVPEIGLTPMWRARLSQRFELLQSWHSSMSDPERIAVRAQLGQLNVLIGTRSALFLPLPRLSLIVVDEEHDSSFKQQDGVAYSARDMSLLLAQEKKIPVILGSATPSLESWRQVKRGSMELLEMPERISGHSHIVPEIVDMRGRHDVLSDALLQALRETKAAGQQSILFLNRRGYAPALQCTACGFVPECHACSMRLTLHRQAGQLRCHGCGYVRRVQRVCEACGEDALLPLGIGTEKLEELLTTEVSDLHFARFDRDMIHTHRQLQDVLTQFAEGELDCLVGTQMLVKGHHFPNVTLVGVVNADLGLNLPDFRAGERWWQQMMQVVGRAGRGEHAGRVLIQTCNPDAPWLARLEGQSARVTLDEEMALREVLAFPPFGRWVRIVFSARKLAQAERAANMMAEALQDWGQVQVSGPMLCAMERIAGRFRMEILLRDASRQMLPWKLAPILDAVSLPSGVRRRIDVDPQDMM